MTRKPRDKSQFSIIHVSHFARDVIYEKFDKQEVKKITAKEFDDKWRGYRIDSPERSSPYRRNYALHRIIVRSSNISPRNRLDFSEQRAYARASSVL